MTTVDVLIAGAGPVGLTTACELIRRGLRVRVVDQHPGPSEHSKAIGVMPRTLELLDRLDLGARLAAEGVYLAGVDFHGRRGRIVSAALPPVASPYRGPLVLPQDRTERLLAERLAGLGVHVEWGTRLARLVQSGDRVRAALAGPDGTEREEEVAWAVGCDGAHSTVRKQLGVPFVGERSAEWWVLADATVELAPDLPTDWCRAFLVGGGLMLVFPLADGRRRVFVELPDHPPDRRPDPTPAHFERWFADRAGVRCRLTDVRWTSAYQISRRVVGSYRAGRVFLAGDAAHIHSPVGGRGMNTGIQDAFNLCWKLELVHKGLAPDALLDTYDAERRPIGEETVRGTHLATRLLTVDNRLVAGVRNWAARLVLGPGSVRRRLARVASMTEMAYPPGPYVAGTGRGRPAPGERAPDGPLVGAGGPVRAFDLFRSPRHALLAFAPTDPQRVGGLAKTYASVLDCHLVRQQPGSGDAPGYDAPGLYLVRPDGYVGFRGGPGDLDPLAAYLGRLFEGWPG